MSLVIRLTKIGKRGEARYRVVVKEKRSKRDGIPTETLGWFHKTEKGQQKDIKKDRYDYWVSKGAQPSLTVREIMK